jgi:hypothetical protein
MAAQASSESRERSRGRLSIRAFKDRIFSPGKAEASRTPSAHSAPATSSSHPPTQLPGAPITSTKWPDQKNGPSTVAELSREVWTVAYEKAREEDPKLVADFELILSRYRNGSQYTTNLFEHCDSEERIALMRDIDQVSRDQSIGRKHMESGAEYLVQLTLAVRETVGGFLDAYPPAALAWSGFCTLTPSKLSTR